MNKLRALFPARFAPIIWANHVLHNVWETMIVSLARIRSDLITPTQSYVGFEPGGVLNVAMLRWS